MEERRGHGRGRSFATELVVDRLMAAKAGRKTSVCLPARDEAATVGAIVTSIVEELVERRQLVDELVVVDDGSSDRTAAIAAAAGATVLLASEVLPEVGPGTGKGEALWKSLAATSGDVVAWCDADIVDFDVRFVTGLLGPLLLRPEIGFVKGSYQREGGRITELVARPLIALLLPQLARFTQPLSGEYAGRRDVLERLSFTQGYGVDLGLLADAVDLLGQSGVEQVDLGERTHRNRPLDELSPAALAVLHEGLRRAGVDGMAWPALLAQPGGGGRLVGDGVRPPLVEVAGYRRRRR